jgi:hypothetical protein
VRATRGETRNERGGYDMIDGDFEALRGVGLTPALAERAAGLPGADGAALVRVTEVQRDRVRVHDGCAERAARVRPRLQVRLRGRLRGDHSHLGRRLHLSLRGHP